MNEPSHGDILRAIGNIEGELSGLIKAVDEMKSAVAGRLDNHGARIGDLEKSRAWFLGAVAVIASIVSAAWAAVVNWLKGGP